MESLSNPDSWLPPKVEAALSPYIGWNADIRAFGSKGKAVRIKLPHATAKKGFVLKTIQVTGITWRGHVDNPIICFKTSEGGFVDICHYIV